MDGSLAVGEEDGVSVLDGEVVLRAGFEFSQSSSEGVDFLGSFDQGVVESGVFSDEEFKLGLEFSDLSTAAFELDDSGSEGIDFSESFSNDGVESFVFGGKERLGRSKAVSVVGVDLKFVDSDLQDIDFLDSFEQETVESVSFTGEVVDSILKGVDLDTRGFQAGDSDLQRVAFSELVNNDVVESFVFLGEQEELGSKIISLGEVSSGFIEFSVSVGQGGTESFDFSSQRGKSGSEVDNFVGVLFEGEVSVSGLFKEEGQSSVFFSKGGELLSGGSAFRDLESELFDFSGSFDDDSIESSVFFSQRSELRVQLGDLNVQGFNSGDAGTSFRELSSQVTDEVVQSVDFTGSFEDEVVESLVFIEKTVDLSSELVDLGGITSLGSESFVFSLKVTEEVVKSAVFIEETVDLGGELSDLGSVTSLGSKSVVFSLKVTDEVVKSGVFVEETVNLSGELVDLGGIASLESESVDFISQFVDEIVESLVFGGEKGELFSVGSRLAGTEFEISDSVLEVFDFVELFLDESVESVVVFKESVGGGSEVLTRLGSSLDSFVVVLGLVEELVSGVGDFSLRSLEVSGLFNEQVVQLFVFGEEDSKLLVVLAQSFLEGISVTVLELHGGKFGAQLFVVDLEVGDLFLEKVDISGTNLDGSKTSSQGFEVSSLSAELFSEEFSFLGEGIDGVLEVVGSGSFTFKSVVLVLPLFQILQEFRDSSFVVLVS